jgi:hypothetical protein
MLKVVMDDKIKHINFIVDFDIINSFSGYEEKSYKQFKILFFRTSQVIVDYVISK